MVDLTSNFQTYFLMKLDYYDSREHWKFAAMLVTQYKCVIMYNEDHSLCWESVVADNFNVHSHSRKLIEQNLNYIHNLQLQ